MDSGKTFTITADADGKFSTGEMDKGRYEIVAEYTHKYGTNESDPLNITASQNDAVLVIILKYVDDVNGDSKNETVYAGDDDKFDTRTIGTPQTSTRMARTKRSLPAKMASRAPRMTITISTLTMTARRKPFGLAKTASRAQRMTII